MSDTATGTETTTADAAAATPATPSPADAAAQAAATAAAAQAAEPAADADADKGKPAAVDMTGWPQAAIDAFTKRDGDAVRYQREAGDQRIQSKRNAAEEARREVLATLTKALDPNAADTDKAPTVDELTAAVAARALDAETVRAAYTNGIDPSKLELLEFKLSRNPDVKTLDHTAADFGTKLSTIVQGEIARDASLAGPVATATTTSTESMVGDQARGTVTQEAFNVMSMTDRAALRTSDPETYRKLADGQ